MSRGAAPVVAVALLVLLAVTLAGALAAGLASVGSPDPPPRAALDLAVDADAARVTLTHLGGETLDVRELRLRVAVDGTPLAQQPPVPFFTARGFRAGPTGPFNSAAAPAWRPGETASLRMAGTNAPTLTPGARIRATVYADGHVVARLSAVAG